MAKKSAKKSVKKVTKAAVAASKKASKKSVKKVASKKAAKKVSGKKKVAKKAATKKAAKKGMPKVAHDRPLEKNEVPTSNDGEVPGAPHFDMVEPPLTRDTVAVEVDGPETYNGELRSENEEDYTEAEVEEDDEDDFKGADFGENEF